MNGFVFDIKRFTLHDGPGIRTTIFLKSCPLNCFWCHNPEGISKQTLEWIQERMLDGHKFVESETIGRYMEVKELLPIIERDQVFYGESGGGVTFSGGEPLVQSAFLLEMIQNCKQKGIHVCIDTSGHAREECFTKILKNCDLLLFDLKHAGDSQHFEGTGVSNKEIINNLKKTEQFSTPIWLRLPFIPGFNMDSGSWNQMLNLLQDIKTGQIQQIHLLPFHQSAAHKYEKCGLDNKMKGIKSVSKEELIPYRNQLLSLGWKNVYIGG